MRAAFTSANYASRLAPRRAKPRLARGFSLLELTLVLAIIGILMAVAAVNILGQGTKAKIQATKATINIVSNALKQYNLDNSAYPPDLKTLQNAKLLDNKPIKDGWRRDLYYDPHGRNKDQPFILGSSGEDGIVGNEDDINIWTMDGTAPTTGN